MVMTGAIAWFSPSGCFHLALRILFATCRPFLQLDRQRRLWLCRLQWVHRGARPLHYGQYATNSAMPAPGSLFEVLTSGPTLCGCYAGVLFGDSYGLSSLARRQFTAYQRHVLYMMCMESWALLLKMHTFFLVSSFHSMPLLKLSKKRGVRAWKLGSAACLQIQMHLQLSEM